MLDGAILVVAASGTAPKCLYEMASRFDHVVGLIRAVGAFKAFQILLYRALRLPSAVAVVPRHAGTRVALRPRESDLFVASQIFGWQEYGIDPARQDAIRKLGRRQLEQGDVPVIVDAGANVGYSALYFAGSYPEALVLALEPDPVTFSVLQQNCAGHDRIRPMHAALWCHDMGVELAGAEFDSWSRRVEEGDDGHPGFPVPSIRLDQLLSTIPSSRLLILKLDIEGAEREVCEASPDTIRAAPCILVEPHDFKFPGAGCLTPLFNAIAGKRVDILLSGENLLIFDSDLMYAARDV
jgi:FkbM family methyltransferase